MDILALPWSQIYNKPSIGDLAGVLPLDKLPVHSHLWADLPGFLPTDKLPVHSHLWTDLPGLLPLNKLPSHSHPYADEEHDHDGVYSPVSHNHDGVYSPIGHNHNGVYALVAHNHDSAYSPTGHIHDDRYFTEVEVTAAIAAAVSGIDLSSRVPYTGATGSVTLGAHNLTAAAVRNAVCGLESSGIRIANNKTIAFSSTTNFLDPPNALLGIGATGQIISAGDGGFAVKDSSGTANGPLLAGTIVGDKFQAGGATNGQLVAGTVANSLRLTGSAGNTGFLQGPSGQLLIGDDPGGFYFAAGFTADTKAIQLGQASAASLLLSSDRTRVQGVTVVALDAATLVARNSAGTVNNLVLYDSGQISLKGDQWIRSLGDDKDRIRFNSSGGTTDLNGNVNVVGVNPVLTVGGGVTYNSQLKICNPAINMWVTPYFAQHASSVGMAFKINSTDGFNGTLAMEFTGSGNVSMPGTLSSGVITSAFQTLTVDPTTSDLLAGTIRAIKNSSSGSLRVWANDGGTIKSAELTITGGGGGGGSGVPYTGATANVNLGTYNLTAAAIRNAVGGLESTGLKLASNKLVAFSTTTNFLDPPDTSLGRGTAGQSVSYGDGGFAVKDAAGSSNAPLLAGSISSGPITSTGMSSFGWIVCGTNPNNTGDLNVGTFGINSKGVITCAVPPATVSYANRAFDFGGWSWLQLNTNYDLSFGVFNNGEQLCIKQAGGVAVTSNLTVGGHVTSAFQTLSADPTITDLSTGLVRAIKNSTNGNLSLWANDAGIIRQVGRAGGTFTFRIDGGGAVITTGAKSVLFRVPYACTINSWELVSDVAGSVVVDIWKSTYAAYPPANSGSITATAKPTLAGQTKAQSSVLNTWTSNLAVGDYLEIEVESAATVKVVSLTLSVTRT